MHTIPLMAGGVVLLGVCLLAALIFSVPAAVAVLSGGDCHARSAS